MRDALVFGLGIGIDRHGRPCVCVGPVVVAWESYPAWAVWRWGAQVGRVFVEVVS